MSTTRHHPQPIIVISGPSGVGKTTIVHRLASRHHLIMRAVTATTRRRRAVERNGRDYHFMSPAHFAVIAQRRGFIESTQYAGQYYGTPASELERIWKQQHVPLVILELKGARAIRRLFPHALLIFIAPGKFSDLKLRIARRHGGLPDAEVQLRLRAAAHELDVARTYYDLVIPNPQGKMNTAVERIERAFGRYMKRFPAWGASH